VIQKPNVEPFRILFDRGHRLAGHPGEGADLSFQGDRLGRIEPVLERVPVAPTSAAGGPMHPTDVVPPHCRRAAL
jgi:hypothetical protein